MTFSIVLRVAALLICIVALTELVVLKELIIPPFVVATFLITLSFLFKSRPKLVLMIAMAVALVIPPAAVAGYLAGALVIAIPIFDTLLFGWILWNALKNLSRLKELASEKE